LEFCWNARKTDCSRTRMTHRASLWGRVIGGPGICRDDPDHLVFLDLCVGDRDIVPHFRHFRAHRRKGQQEVKINSLALHEQDRFSGQNGYQVWGPCYSSRPGGGWNPITTLGMDSKCRFHHGLAELAVSAGRGVHDHGLRNQPH
jgi:hypothetical protein